MTVIPSTLITFPGGSISNAFAVPTLPRTGTPYSVIVTVPGNVDTANISAFTITPVIWLSVSSGKVADSIHVSGYGFLADTNITISFDNTAITTVYSDSSGTFYNKDLVIPSVIAGWHTISARDYVGSSPGTSFVVSPSITSSSSTGTVGSSINCSGKGFAAHSNISFSLDSTTLSGSAVTNASGEFNNASLTIPPIAGGDHTLKARDASGNTATTGITINAAITINPDNGPAGTTITVTGNGFQANGSINITYHGVIVTTSPSPLTTTSTGSFTATFMASSLPSGVYTVIASDATRTATAQFNSSATAVISPSSGTVGTTITVDGAGFKAKSAIYINYDGSQIAHGTSDSNGNFTITFTAVSSSTGTHQITVTDNTNTSKLSFNIMPAIQIEPTNGFVGSDITVSGTGFTSKHTVSFKYSDELLSSSSTDADGTFTVVLKAPASQGGNHIIAVSDGTSTLMTTFVMDSAAPAAPPLLSPQALTKASKAATFSWQEATDPSGVTYTLQIATDDTFSVLILQKEGLLTPTYTLTKEETLKSVSKKTPYYWRVKAIDGALNESAWSIPSTFYVGFVLTDWIQYVIFGVVAILFGVIGYILAMLRFRPKPPPTKEVSSE
jgi:hypothetical protein